MVSRTCRILTGEITEVAILYGNVMIRNKAIPIIPAELTVSKIRTASVETVKCTVLKYKFYLGIRWKRSENEKLTIFKYKRDFSIDQIGVIDFDDIVRKIITAKVDLPRDICISGKEIKWIDPFILLQYDPVYRITRQDLRKISPRSAVIPIRKNGYIHLLPSGSDDLSRLMINVNLFNRRIQNHIWSHSGASFWNRFDNQSDILFRLRGLLWRYLILINWDVSHCSDLLRHLDRLYNSLPDRQIGGTLRVFSHGLLGLPGHFSRTFRNLLRLGRAKRSERKYTNQGKDRYAQNKRYSFFHRHICILLSVRFRVLRSKSHIFRTVSNNTDQWDRICSFGNT